MHIPILAYHNIGSQFEWGLNTVSPRLFRKQIRFLAEQGYRSISLHDLLENRIPYEKPIAITFDDSYRSIFRYAYPILKRYGFTATVFVVSEYVGEKNSWDANLGGKTSYHLNWRELEQLANSGWEIGSHTATHPDLTKLSQAEIDHELIFSKQQLEKRLALRVRLLSYPYNRFNTQVILAAEQADYEGGCCLAKNNSIPESYYRFSISRRGVYAIDELFWFKIKLNNTYLSRIEDMRQILFCFCARGSIWYKRHKK